jgi:hypothetical protein
MTQFKTEFVFMVDDPSRITTLITQGVSGLSVTQQKVQNSEQVTL